MQRLTIMLAIASACISSLSASTVISGTFDLDGSLTATLNTVTWTSNSGTANQATITDNGDLSGSFVGLGNTLVSIEDLNRVTEPVGTTFAEQPFISFLSPLASSFPTLMINYIALGSGSSTDCTAPAAAGQTCTLSSAQVPGGSPFTFINTSTTLNGVTTLQSSATFDFSGLTSDGMSAWTGIFTAQFNSPFQTVLSEFETTGSVTNSYSDSNLVITLTQSSVPEPEAWTLMGVGLLLLAASRIRLPRRQSR